ncbi:unnamed protein product [Leuciscus chuanchicus]
MIQKPQRYREVNDVRREQTSEESSTQTPPEATAASHHSAANSGKRDGGTVSRLVAFETETATIHHLSVCSRWKEEERGRDRKRMKEKGELGYGVSADAGDGWEEFHI